MKLEYHCDPEVNNHKECSGKVIVNEDISDCECWCHDPEKVKKLINANTPPILYSFGMGV